MNSKMTTSLAKKDILCIETFLTKQTMKRKHTKKLNENEKKYMINVVISRILALYSGIKLAEDVYKISFHRGWKIIHDDKDLQIVGTEDDTENIVIKYPTSNKWMIIEQNTTVNVPIPICMQSVKPYLWRPYIDYLTQRMLEPTTNFLIQNNIVTSYVPILPFETLITITDTFSLLSDWINSWIITHAHLNILLNHTNLKLCITTSNQELVDKRILEKKYSNTLNYLKNLSMEDNKDLYNELTRINFHKKGKNLTTYITNLKNNISIIYRFLEKNIPLENLQDFQTKSDNCVLIAFDYYIEKQRYNILLLDDHFPFMKKLNYSLNLPCILLHSYDYYLDISKKIAIEHSHNPYTFSQSVIAHHAVVIKTLFDKDDDHNETFTTWYSESVSDVFERRLRSSPSLLEDDTSRGSYMFKSDIDVVLLRNNKQPIMNKKVYEQDIHTRLVLPGMILTTAAPHIGKKFINNNNIDVKEELSAPDHFIDTFRSYCNFSSLQEIAPVVGIFRDEPLLRRPIVVYRLSYASEQKVNFNDKFSNVCVDFPIFTHSATSSSTTTTEKNKSINKQKQELQAIGVRCDNPKYMSNIMMTNVNVSINSPLVSIIYKMFPNTIKRYSPCINYALLAMLKRRFNDNPVGTLNSIDTLCMEILVCWCLQPVFFGCRATSRDALGQIITSCEDRFFLKIFLAYKMRIKYILQDRAHSSRHLKDILPLNKIITDATTKENRKYLRHILIATRESFLVPVFNHLYEKEGNTLSKKDNKTTNNLSMFLDIKYIAQIATKCSSRLRNNPRLNSLNINTPILHVLCVNANVSQIISMIPSSDEEKIIIIEDSDKTDMSAYIKKSLIEIKTTTSPEDFNSSNLEASAAKIYASLSKGRLPLLEFEQSHETFNIDTRNTDHKSILMMFKKIFSYATPKDYCKTMFYTCIHGVMFGTGHFLQKDESKEIITRKTRCINLVAEEQNHIWELLRVHGGGLSLDVDAINETLQQQRQEKEARRYFFFGRHTYDPNSSRYIFENY